MIVKLWGTGIYSLFTNKHCVENLNLSPCENNPIRICDRLQCHLCASEPLLRWKELLVSFCATSRSNPCWCHGTQTPWCAKHPPPWGGRQRQITVNIHTNRLYSNTNRLYSNTNRLYSNTDRLYSWATATALPKLATYHALTCTPVALATSTSPSAFNRS